jgi:hypothetical protein
MTLNDCMIVNHEVEHIWKKVVVAYVKVLFRQITWRD